MNNLLLLYPKEFLSYEKFERKVTRILTNLSEYQLTFPADPNGFIKTYFKEKNAESKISNTWRFEDITHAIVFDDGEEFTEELHELRKRAIPTRLIKIAITRVINIKQETQYKNLKQTATYEYIGRGSQWGNPHSMYDSGDDREEVIRKFEYDFVHDKFPHLSKADANHLAGKRLGCFCKPLACHGDILADYLNGLDDGQ